VVRLVRSKGVGVYFVTQNPIDIPDSVLGQLGNRVQHALRAYTPRDQKAVQAAAETFRANPKLDTATAIMELGVGEALVSFLDEKGRPTMVERAFILAPASQIGPITDAERNSLIASSIVAGVYEKAVDRDSAYEKLTQRVAATVPTREQAQTQTPTPQQGGSAAETAPANGGGGFGEMLGNAMGGLFGGAGVARRKDTVVEAMVKSAARTMGSTVGRELIRGVLGSLLKRK
jgi:DNA helicase HerA-like ATPase